jgi:hypothetical protein
VDSPCVIVRRFGCSGPDPSGAKDYHHLQNHKPAPYNERVFVVQDRIMTVVEYDAELRDVLVTSKASSRQGRPAVIS